MLDAWRVIEAIVAAVGGLCIAAVAVVAAQANPSRADTVAIAVALVAGLGISASAYRLYTGANTSVTWADRLPAVTLVLVGVSVVALGVWAFRPWLSSITGLLFLMPTILSVIAGGILVAIGGLWSREEYVYRPLGLLAIAAFVTTTYNLIAIV